MAKRQRSTKAPSFDVPMNRGSSLAANELVQNILTLRSQLLKQLIDPRRDLDEECGYPDPITTDMLLRMYDRDGVANRVVGLYPREAWKMEPEIYEDEDPDAETDFEIAWNKLQKKHNLLHYMQRMMSCPALAATV